MKKLISFVTILLSIVILSACGQKQNNEHDGHNHDHDHSKEHNHDHGDDGHDHDHDDKAEEKTEEASNVILFTEEQSKYILDFKVEEVKKQTFHQILKTSGQILSAPGDEMLISATMSGIVNISSPKLVEGFEVGSGQQLFSISSRNLSENNTSALLNEAKAILENTKSEYNRAVELAKEKIISEKEFQQAKLNYEQAKLNYQTYSSGMSSGGKVITSPMRGYLKNLMVQSGQYVEIGQSLATVTQNKRLILKAEVSQRYHSMVNNITSATFATPYDNQVYDLTELNGRLISVGKNSGINSYLIPVSFEFDNKGNIIEGSFVEIYLKSQAINDAITIPKSALIEEQGRYFVFMALDHENEYIKKEVKVGANDGINYQILAGIAEGEKIVTKGAYALKLASMSASMPEHAHQH